MKVVIIEEDRDFFYGYLSVYHRTREIFGTEAGNFNKFHNISECLFYLIQEWNYHCRNYKDSTNQECITLFQTTFKKIKEQFGVSCEITDNTDNLLKECLRLIILYQENLTNILENYAVNLLNEVITNFKISPSNKKAARIKILDITSRKGFVPSVRGPFIENALQFAESIKKTKHRLKKTIPTAVTTASTAPSIQEDKQKEINHREQEDIKQAEIEKNRQFEIEIESKRIKQEELIKKKQAEEEIVQHERIEALREELTEIDSQIAKLSSEINGKKSEFKNLLTDYNGELKTIEYVNSEVRRYNSARINSLNNDHKTSALEIKEIQLPNGLVSVQEHSENTNSNYSAKATSPTKQYSVKALETELKRSIGEHNVLSAQKLKQEANISNLKDNMAKLTDVTKSKIHETNQQIQIQSGQLYRDLEREIQEKIANSELQKEKINDKYLIFEAYAISFELKAFKESIEQKTGILSVVCDELISLSSSIESKSIKTSEVIIKLNFIGSILPLYFTQREVVNLNVHLTKISNLIKNEHNTIKKYKLALDSYNSSIDEHVKDLKNELLFYNPITDKNNKEYRQVLKEALESLYSILFTVGNTRISNSYLQKLLGIVQTGLLYFEGTKDIKADKITQSIQKYVTNINDLLSSHMDEKGENKITLLSCNTNQFFTIRAKHQQQVNKLCKQAERYELPSPTKVSFPNLL